MFRGCSQFIILFVLAAVVGFLIYNQSQVNRMKQQVDSLSSRFKVGKNNDGKKDIVTPMVTAKKHAVQAKALLKKGNKAAAEAELDNVIKSLDAADNVSRDIVGEIGDFAGKARDKLTSAYKQAVKDINNQMNTQNGKTDKKSGN